MRHCLYDCLVRHVFLFLLLLSVLKQATDEDPDVVVDSDGDEDDSDGDDDNSDGDEDDLDGEVAPSCPLPGHEGILPKSEHRRCHYEGRSHSEPNIGGVDLAKICLGC